MATGRPYRAYCSYYAPRGTDGRLWPSHVRQETPVRVRERHPRGFCQNVATMRLEVTQQFGVLSWEAHLCVQHALMFTHLHGTQIPKTKQKPAEQIHLYPVETPGAPEEPSTRKPRRWTPPPEMQLQPRLPGTE